MRTKIKADPVECCACHLQVLGRGGDLEGWVAVQKDPDIAVLSWFCMKPICQNAYHAALQEAQVIWAGGELEAPEPQEPEQKSEPPSQKPKPSPTPDSLEKLVAHDLVAYETSDQEEMGFKDEVVDENKLPFSFEEKPEEPPEPPPAQERYVPRPSATKSEAKFVRHDGTGSKTNDGGSDD